MNRLVNFLQDDLKEIDHSFQNIREVIDCKINYRCQEESMLAKDIERLETFISYWKQHSKSLEKNMSNKITIPTEKWVELYGLLSSYVLEYSSLDPTTKIEPNGDEVYTEEKQDEYNHIVGDVEDILRTFFIKEEA